MNLFLVLKGSFLHLDGKALEQTWPAVSTPTPCSGGRTGICGIDITPREQSWLSRVHRGEKEINLPSHPWYNSVACKAEFVLGAQA